MIERTNEKKRASKNCLCNGRESASTKLTSRENYIYESSILYYWFLTFQFDVNRACMLVIRIHDICVLSLDVCACVCVCTTVCVSCDDRTNECQKIAVSLEFLLITN